MIRPAWLLLAAALLAGPAEAAASPPDPATIPVSRMSTPWWRERFEQKQAELRSGHFDLVWLGDSITQDWELAGPEPWRDFAPIWQRFYGARHAVNLGFKGDSTAHLLWRLLHGELDIAPPRLAILLIGANNFGRVHNSAEQTLGGIEAVLALLHQRWPTTRVILLPVLPSIRSPWVSTQTAILDAALARHHGDATFVDVAPLFLTNGSADADNFIDPHLQPPDPPLHPTAQAQARIAEQIEPEVEDVLPR